jgi:hypothetical protein
VSATKGNWGPAAGTFSYVWQVDRHDGNGFTDMTSRTQSSLYLYAGDPSLFAVGWTYRVAVFFARSGYVDSAPNYSSGITLR